MNTSYDKTKYDYTLERISDHEIILSVDNKDVKKYIDRTINDLIDKELSCAYHSKYNSYVVYDYEPFSVEGFWLEPTYKIKGGKVMTDFAIFLINQAMRNWKDLEYCGLIQPYTDKVHTKI